MALDFKAYDSCMLQPKMMLARERGFVSQPCIGVLLRSHIISKMTSTKAKFIHVYAGRITKII